MPQFSVIIPAYNRASMLVEALDSVFAQEFTDFEVIVVDDGSTDGTAAIASGYGDRVQVLQQPKSGPGSARNLGLRHATGRYAAFLDSDDIWFPWTLSIYSQVIEACNEPTLVAGGCVRFVQTSDVDPARSAVPAYRSFADYYAASTANISIFTSGAVARRDAIAHVGGFLEGFVNAEDSDLWMKLGTSAGFTHLTAPIVFAYRMSPASASKMPERTFDGMRQLVLTERTGRYPGGRARQRERRRLLTAHLRPASLACLQTGNVRGALWLYCNSFQWNLAQARCKYLLGFWLFVLRQLVRAGLALTKK